MKTKYVIATTLALLLATATLAYATTYQSECTNDSPYDIDVEIKVITGLSVAPVFHVLKHTVLIVVYVFTGVVSGLLGLTWKIKCFVHGVHYSVNVLVPLGAKVKIYAPVVGQVCVAVNGVLKATMYV